MSKPQTISTANSIVWGEKHIKLPCDFVRLINILIKYVLSKYYLYTNTLAPLHFSFTPIQYLLPHSLSIGLKINERNTRRTLLGRNTAFLVPNQRSLILFNQKCLCGRIIEDSKYVLSSFFLFLYVFLFISLKCPNIIQNHTDCPFLCW